MQQTQNDWQNMSKFPRTSLRLLAALSRGLRCDPEVSNGCIMVSPAYSLGKARSTSTPGTICCYICFGESYFKVVVLRHLQSSSCLSRINCSSIAMLCLVSGAKLQHVELPTPVLCHGSILKESPSNLCNDKGRIGRAKITKNRQNS